MTEERKIKLLLLIPSLECGGSEKYVATLCNNIDTDKFAVILVVINNASPFYTITNKEIQVVDLKTKKVRNSLFKIRRILQQQQPDIVFSAANHLNLLLAMFRWLFPKKIKIVARESSLVSRNSDHAKFSSLYKKLIKRYYQKVDAIICQSAAMQKDLVDNFNVPVNKTIVIHNPVEVFQNAQPSINTKNKFITVARLSPEKGIDRLIKAVALLKNQFSYYIIGEGDQLEPLQKLIKQLNLEEKVFLTGKKNDPFAGMEDAALFLLGSHYEGFPNAALEANALGIPVIAFDVPGGINEIITENENGLLVNYSRINEFAAAIEKGLQMPFDRKRISNTTQQRFETKGIIKSVEEWLLEVYHK